MILPPRWSHHQGKAKAITSPGRVWRISPRKTVTPLGKFLLLAVFLSCKVVRLHAGAFLETAKGRGFCFLEMRHQCYNTNIFIVIVSHSKEPIFFLGIASTPIGFSLQNSWKQVDNKVGRTLRGRKTFWRVGCWLCIPREAVSPDIGVLAHPTGCLWCSSITLIQTLVHSLCLEPAGIPAK